ncbi:hypothetical protein HK104_001056, partial [Borealophlyctis nickersoniae]
MLTVDTPAQTTSKPVFAQNDPTTDNHLSMTPSPAPVISTNTREPQLAKEFDVMISYRWANKDDVLWIKGALERRGYSIWFDEEQMPEVGDIYDGMWEGISKSKVVCPFLSVHYENSENCKRELKLAADLKRMIVPIRLDCGPFTWAHAITAGLLYVDFSDKSHDKNEKMDELVNLIVSALREQQTSVPPTSSNPPTTMPVTPVISKEELKQLLDPTDIVNMENDVEEVNRKRLPGTREWLLQDVKDWAEDSGASSIFWLVALAGAG